MQEIRHLVFSVLLVLECIMFKFYLHQFSVFITVILFINAIISVILFSSPILSVSYFFSVLLIFDILGLEVYVMDFTNILSYLAGIIFSSSIFTFVIRRRLDDALLLQLNKAKISLKWYNILVSILIFAISFVINFVYIHNSFILLGSLASSFILIFISNYELYPLIFTSWLSFPYLLSQIGYTKPTNGVYLGEMIGILRRTTISLSKINTNSSYKWFPSRSKFYLDFNSNKNFNVIILGTSGSGKSYLAKSIISNGNLGFLIFDIHGEYSMPNAQVLDASRISINPLSLFGQSPRQRALEVSYMLKSLFNLGNLQTIELSNIILETYTEKGIYDDDETSWINKPPTFRDVLILMEKKKKVATTSQEIGRIESLEPYVSFLVSSTFMDTSIDIFELLKNNVIINLAKITVPEIKYVIIETLLSSIQSFMYLTGQSNFRKMVIIDEAPFILSKESGKQVVERLFAEGRKFGFGFMVISQSAEYVKRLIPNSAYIFVLNMTEPTEIEYISRLLGGQDTDIFKAIYNTLQRLDRGLIITRDILRDEIILVRSN